MTFRLRLADLVSAMQLKYVYCTLEEATKSAGSGQIQCVTSEFALGPKGRITVRYPFTVELGTSPPNVATEDKRTKLQNPIRRAQAWSEELEKTPDLSIRGLAQR